MLRAGKKSGGVTLIELMVLIVIIGVVSAMAIPRLSGSLANASLRSAARDLKTATQYTRDFAISHQTPTRLVIDPEQNLYMLQARQTTEEGEVGYAKMTLAMTGTRELARGVKFGSVQIEPSVGAGGGGESSSSTAEVNFDELGQADAAVIELRNERHFWTLYIAPSSGRVTLVEGDDDPPGVDREDLDA